MVQLSRLLFDPNSPNPREDVAIIVSSPGGGGGGTVHKITVYYIFIVLYFKPLEIVAIGETYPQYL